MLLKTDIDVPFQFKTQLDLLKIVKKSQPNIKDNILVSKYWDTKAVFRTIDFCPRRFFCWSFKTKALSCNNIQTTLEKILMSKCDISFIEISLPPDSCLLGNFSIIVGACFWYSFAVITIFILCVDLFNKLIPEAVYQDPF